MTKRVVWGLAVLGVAILAAISCRRSELRTVAIDVPQMGDARCIRIVTNAALDEVVGQYDGVPNDIEVDLSKRIVLYHESHRLLSSAYQRQIEARIQEVGLEANVLDVRLNPPSPVPTDDGPVQMWPDRFTAVIYVPAMTAHADVNIVADAIAYARIGRDDPRVSVDASSRRVWATYESLRLSPENIEHAIACVGFDANETPAYLGRSDPIPHGWTPVKL